MEIAPLVSICIPTYNGEAFLEEALDSVLEQTYENYEVIISDDASKDNTIQLVEQFKERCVKPVFVFEHEPSGIGANWNHSVNKANGEYIKFLFQDDTLEPDCLEKMIQPFMDNESVGLVACQRKFILEEEDAESRDWIASYSNLQKEFPPRYGQVIGGKEVLKRFDLLKDPKNKIGEPTAVLFKKSMLEAVGNFNETLKQALDYECWYRMLKKCDMIFLDEALISFRLHAQQATAQNKKSTIPDPELYPKLLYQDFFWFLAPKVRWQLFKRYHTVGRGIQAIIRLIKK